MSALPTRTFRVCLDTWDVFSTTVEAASAEEALATIRARYDAGGLNALEHMYEGDDGFRVEEVRR